MLDEADHDVTTFRSQPMPFLEHGVGLPHPRGSSQEDLQPATAHHNKLPGPGVMCSAEDPHYLRANLS